ncbi:MAG TPA: c-type cytochrome [Croceibacterium sp.]|nr:c-type cytochrome [Croceibacterium sp.]
MTLAPTSATALALLLALTACGGDEEGADEVAVSDTPAPVETATPATGATPAASETPEPAPSETPSATPTPSPTPTATTAAAAKPAEFAVCAACHSTEPGKNGIGPTLAGVFGARAGHVAAFDYSEAMENSALTWNQANLDRYLADPKGVVPGTKMAYPGLKDAAKRQAMIAYLRTL